MQGKMGSMCFLKKRNHSRFYTESALRCREGHLWYGLYVFDSRGPPKTNWIAKIKKKQDRTPQNPETA